MCLSHWLLVMVDIILSSCRESYEIGRIPSGVGAVKQARTLRLLANAYLEWDGVTYWQKALNAVGPSSSITQYIECPTVTHEILSCRSC